MVGSLAPYFLPLPTLKTCPVARGSDSIENNQRNKQDERSGPGFNLKLPRLNAVADFSEGRFLVHDEHDEALGWMTASKWGAR